MSSSSGIFTHAAYPNELCVSTFLLDEDRTGFKWLTFPIAIPFKLPFLKVISWLRRLLCQEWRNFFGFGKAFFSEVIRNE
jgi:hypothetical protein